jgi:UDP-N-acetylmuramoyl-tripeptide--D-alanyl-D-alanine ligase
MMDIATAARAVEGRILGENVRFTGVATDTRAIAEGDLFVALKGERFDGHDFVGVAQERGAAAAIVASDRAHALPGNRIAVADPLAALGRLATHWRARFSLPVIAIVGSNGKTTVKEMLAAILRARHGAEEVLATRGNFNNAIGLPLTILRLRERHRAAVIELGMNHPGETAELAAITQPTIAVINNAQREHQEFMKSVADVAAEHAAIVRALPSDGIVVLNADDPHVDVWRAAARGRSGVRVVDFAVDAPAATRLIDAPAATRLPAANGEGGETIVFTTPDGEATARLSALGRHNVSNALAAAAAALAIGTAVETVVRGLESFRPAAGRLVPLKSTVGAAVLDDTYNANPDSVEAAIDGLAAAPAPRWLVLGDMGEVGEEGPRFHDEIGTYARAAGIERLYAAGPLTAASIAAFGAGGEHFSSVEALAEHVAKAAGADTTVLVKGSRFMRMERVVAALCGTRAKEGTH